MPTPIVGERPPGRETLPPRAQSLAHTIPVQRPMSADAVRLGRARVVRDLGPWSNHNSRLADDVSASAPGLDDLADRRIRRTVVADNALRPRKQLRILDVGSYEGGFAIEFAHHAAAVRARGPRRARPEERLSAQAPGLPKLQVLHGDARTIEPATHGSFDVILCLGLLCQLPADDLMPVLSTLAAMCTGDKRERTAE